MRRIIGAMSRLRRMVLSDRFFFVTCRLLPRRARLAAGEFENLARVIRERRQIRRLAVFLHKFRAYFGASYFRLAV